MRLLLTGSSGWLGRFLAPRLRADGQLVTGLDIVKAQIRIAGDGRDRLGRGPGAD